MHQPVAALHFFVGKAIRFTPKEDRYLGHIRLGKNRFGCTADVFLLIASSIRGLSSP